MELAASMKCSTCGQPLLEGELFTANGLLYCSRHMPRDAVPMCDFCAEPEPMWLYNAGSNIVVGILDERDETITATEMGTKWAACDGCRTLVDSDDAHGLVDRIIALRGWPEDLKHVKQEMRIHFKDVMLTYFTAVLEQIERPPTEFNLGLQDGEEVNMDAHKESDRPRDDNGGFSGGRRW